MGIAKTSILRDFSIWRLIIYPVIIYLFIMAPRLNMMGGLNLGYLAVLAVAVLDFKTLLKPFFNRKFLKLIAFLLFIVGYHVFMTFIYGNSPQHVIKISMSMVFSIFWGYHFTHILITKYGWTRAHFQIWFLKVVVIGIFLNAVLVVMESVNVEIRTLFETFQYNDPTANISYLDHAFRLRGFVSSGGAALSVMNAVAIWFIIILAKRKVFSLNFSLVMMLFISASNIFIGRTGLLIGLLFTLIYILFVYAPMIFDRKLPLRLAVMIIFITGVGKIMNDLDINVAGVAWAFEWMEGIEDNKVETESTDDLKGMLFLPSDFMHLTFGIGFFDGYNDLYPRSDSGYLKTLFSLGIIFGLLFYMVLYYQIYRICTQEKQLKAFFYPLIIVFLLIEIKEPFLYQNFLSRVIFALLGCYFYYDSIGEEQNEELENMERNELEIESSAG